MLREHWCVSQRVWEMLVKIDHPPGDAAFGGWHTGDIGTQAELIAQGGLDAATVEQTGGLGRFLADQLDAQRVLVIRPDLAKNADEFPGGP